jgi:helix-turn-helix protein
MSFVKESEYKKYIQDNFMNQASTKHLENQTNIDTIDDNNISKTHEEIIEIGIKNETQLLDFTYIDNETLSNLVEYERD